MLEETEAFIKQGVPGPIHPRRPRPRKPGAPSLAQAHSRSPEPAAFGAAPTPKLVFANSRITSSTPKRGARLMPQLTLVSPRICALLGAFAALVLRSEERRVGRERP